MQIRPELSKLVDAITSGNVREKREAIDQFSSAYLEDGFVIVEPLLSSADATHRIAGIEALAGNTTESVVHWLAEHAEGDPSAEVRLECMRQLDDIPSKDSRDLFLKKVTDPDRRVRQLVASGLRHYGDDEITRTLATFVVDDDVYVQERAIESLALSDSPGLSYLMHLLLPLWEGTYWEAIIQPRANAQGDRGLVQELTESFQKSLLAREHPTLPALRWMSFVDPEDVLSFADKCLLGNMDEAVGVSIQALSELLRMSAQIGESRRYIHERCIALLHVIAERAERSEATEKARLLLEQWQQ